ncbi:GNAT family N-acetyltransferase [Roseateles flavus]|uniref:GNAT family N-acetyltransferase n=1 Tax=Roseateles flavus TaxID=3149041 RepID=A0ABV0GAV0_9BURK
MPIPVLASDRLSLVPSDASCAPAYERFFTDASASDGYGGAPLAAEAARARLEADRQAWALHGFGLWVIRHEGRPVGACGFAQKPGWPRELTGWLLPAHRGQGLAREASRIAIGQAYAIVGGPSVETCMKDSNAAARALALSLGGIRIGRPVFADGLARDLFRLPRGAHAGRALLERTCSRR